MRARLAVSIGCPCGIGPEVAVVAAYETRARVVLIGDLRALESTVRVRDLDPRRLVRVTHAIDAWSLPNGTVGVFQPTKDLAPKDLRPGFPTRASGAAELSWIYVACDLARARGADAMVTGPVSKEAIVRSGAPGSAAFLGHTEHLQRRLHAREVVMAFWSKELTTALVTTHLPLSAVPRAITAASVARATYWLGVLLASVGVSRTKRARSPLHIGAALRVPTIAVAGLNPHAGEAGLLGTEDRAKIVPGIARARARLAAAGVRVDVVGPVPAESAFRLAVGGRFDGVVAMYHDQATIPMKLVGFGEAVNVSLALPIVRTSVDHGTAYDLAGKGVADARGMREAIELACVLARARERVSAGAGEGAPAKVKARPTRSAPRA
jgi:4-hydroxythreonine-4-phosphate dehydrogenase